MKRFLFLASIFLLSSASSIHALDSSLQSLEDQALIQQDRGHYLQALELWQRLHERYQKAGLKDKAAAATIQIALTQQSLGSIVSACYTLQELLNVRESVCVPASRSEAIRSAPSLNTQNEVIAAINFARILRDLGAHEIAIPFADMALATSQQQGYTHLIPPLAIAKGTIQWAKLQEIFDQWQYQGSNGILSFEAQEQIEDFQSTFQAYESAFEGKSEIDAKLKWLGLYQDLEKQAAAYRDNLFNDLIADRKADSLSLTDEILALNTEDFQKFSLSEKLRLMRDRAKLMVDGNHSESKRFIQELLAAAIDHQEYLAESYGLLGKWYQGNDDQEQAIDAYHQASILGSEKHSLFQWQYEIARAFEKLGNESQAERFYESAITLLEKAQQDVSPVKNYLKLHFQESVRPIYDDYSRFHLSKDKPNIAKVFEVRNRYSERVVEFYLGCGKLERLTFQEITDKDPSAAYVSIFRVGKLYYTLLKQGKSYSYKTIDAQEVEKAISILSSIFDSDGIKPRVPILNSYLQVLNDAVFKPIEEQLTPGQTLLFLGLEPNLLQIPMASLFDGSEYLIEKHPVALLTNSLATAPKEDQASFETLFVGISEQADKNFTDLPYVTQEAKVVSPNRLLLDEKFTQPQLTKAIQADIQVLHIATHGQFSSDPNQTFLLAWDQKLTIPSIRKILQERALNQVPIDLLILSACETAKGDRLAAMGLAGISVEAGAQSTIASIWKAIDASSPFFMERLYFHLRSGETKAKAIQLAQVEMIKAEYTPYSWATYILTGNWL